MVALPGLTLVTGQYDIARQILDGFAEVMDRGILPNRFPDAGEAPEYNTVDATLWFFEAVRAYAQYAGDYAYVRQKLYAKLKDSFDWHLPGTRYGIRADSDGRSAPTTGVDVDGCEDRRLGGDARWQAGGDPGAVGATLRTMEDFVGDAVSTSAA